jgi:hypothetical protein
MPPKIIIWVGVACLLAGCARIIIQIGEGHKSDAEISAATDTQVDVKRENKEKQ